MAISVIIPAKNEEQNIVNLLHSLRNQEFDWSGSEIILADANSSDATSSLAQQYCSQYDMPLIVIEGGLPAVARNSGARRARNQLLIFMDADIVLEDTATLSQTVAVFESQSTALVSCNIRCREDLRADFLFRSFNLIQYSSKFFKPCASTMYFAINRDVFWSKGGFDENAKHCEDVLLSKQIPKRGFKIINSTLRTYNRRFTKQGYLGFVVYFMNNLRNWNNKEYFYKDINYWS